ncbi:Cytochrome P450 [Macleaya cordata]|uniref:Cytochrome P450 n=1 Tax=Macleaya cordata TaxID=56857 RepID=A0A200QJS1_MACCD|nr:Cytochrome P450 [Macleaya cordata]
MNPFSTVLPTGDVIFRQLHLFLFSLFIIFLTIFLSLHQKKRHALPVWPLLGMLPSFLIGIYTEIYEWTTKILTQQNGTFTFRGPSFAPDLHSIITSDPRNIEYILKTNFPNYPKGKLLRTQMHDLLGDGIFNSDGETWRYQRRIASIEIHSAEFRNLTTESLNQLVHSRLLPVFEDFSEKSVGFDLQEFLLRLTFDNVCMIVFGVELGCLSLGLPDEIPFARAFEDAAEATIFRMYVPEFLWKMMRFMDLGWEKRLKRSVKKVDGFVEEVIFTRMKELSSMGIGNSSSSRSGFHDLLSVFMGLKDDEGKPFSYKFLRDICVNFVLAGRDSSSVALSWFFWLLDQNPVVEERIVEELCKIVLEREEDNSDDQKKNKGENGNFVVFKAEEVKKMDYLQAALSESLRLYPSVPFDRKEVIEDDVFPDGTKIKKGMKVVYSIYSMGRMESIWGKDCREFKPERWLRDGKFTSESPYKFTAFNGGPRLCLGKDIAYYQMKFVAASIIYHYRVKVVENHPVATKLAMTMYMKYGLKVTLKRRDESIS